MPRPSLFSCVLFLWALHLAAAAPAQQTAVPDSIDKDYSAELPRIAPQEPAQALATFQVAPGFHLEQAAAEPLVSDPIALAFDENSRLFVCEMRGYSENRDQKLSRIRLLTDADGDGRFDHSTIFADGLLWPTALHCWAGGLFVADAPDLLYLKDTTGDGVADERRVIASGFGLGNVQGLTNSFAWGLDNRIYGATSSSGAELRLAAPEVTTEKSATEKTSPPLTLRGRDYAFDPRALAFAAVTGGAQHGLSLSDWGDRFVCSNSDHLQHCVLEDAYLGRNPYLAASGARRSIAADGPQADVFRISAVEPWRIVRTRLRAAKIVPGIVEGGGRPSGYFTSATGVTIYRGDAYPQQWRGMAVVGDVGSNIVHRKRLEPSGASFVARRIDEKSEFIASSDLWFRPVQFANGPDGCLYICDMYREVVEHPLSIPPILKKHLDLTSGRERGRIYRITPTGFKRPPQVKLGGASTVELVQALGSNNGWTRDTAARLLYERQDPSAATALEKLATAAASPLARLHALYALAGLGRLTAEPVLVCLAHEEPRLREHAARLGEGLAEGAPAVREALLRLADDGDFRVRFQAALSLGALPAAQRAPVLARLLKQDGGEKDLRVAALSSLGEGAGFVLATLARDDAWRATPSGKELLSQLAAQIGRQQRPEDRAALLDLLRELAAAKSPLLAVLAPALGVKAESEFGKQISAVTAGQADAALAALVQQARATALDASAPSAARVAALAQLRLATWPQAEPALTAALAPSAEAELQAAAISAAAGFSERPAGALLLAALPSLSPKLKSQALDALTSRPAWALAVLEAVKAKELPAGELDPARLKLLSASGDSQIRKLAGELLQGAGLGRRAEVVAAYRPALELPGDAARGKAVYTKNCSACHRLQGVGQDIGPSLAAMKNRGPEVILLNVLDPNREVNPQYLSYLLLRTDGRTHTGLIAAESAASVTLRRAEGQADTVLRVDIESLQSSGQSLMPEGLEKQINPQQLADLLEYLRIVE